MMKTHCAGSGAELLGCEPMSVGRYRLLHSSSIAGAGPVAGGQAAFHLGQHSVYLFQSNARCRSPDTAKNNEDRSLSVREEIRRRYGCQRGSV